EQNSGSLREHSVISKKTSSNRKTAIESGRAAGILMSEEDVIFGHLDMFCQRIRCLIDQMVSLSQFQLLFKSSSNLSRPKREDLRLTDERGMQYDSESDEDFDEDFETKEKSEVVLKDLDLGDYSSKPSLAVLIEENEETKRKKSSAKKMSEKIEFKSEANLSTSDLGSDEYLQEDYKDDTRSESPTKSLLGTTERLFNTEKNVEAESKRILKKAQTFSKEDIKLMKKYYSRKNEGPTVSFIIEDHIKLMKNSMKEVKSSHILDVGTKDANVFQESYQTFLNAQSNLEKFLAAYLNVIFCKTKKTHDGLNVLTTFLPVSQRNILRPIINDKYVEIFSIYQTDLSETEDNFDYYRNNPPILRNAPPIGGAISWVRQMLKKIDEPMKVFKENKYINSLSDFWLTLKQYNSLTFAMINFENEYLSAWKTTIDEAKNGLKDC
ncbi:dynein gamma flagellar outer arm-like, partial [Brachionus plicatilis]